ncbi:subtilisin-like protein [Aureobasidium pullulans]|uniref:tripeptidyl-peptidase II n=1 Tax=Aureobasidium pullulans TaxID=5580 RepID=A0A4V4K5R7_AURPU|nr:subtilisin-like protein [Aureobasidium pullulans]THZ30001.1 subtilisin-like protein [Aureobasidium pullulans]TIA43826.1 subtilisin-like protein [Aureobasidium pullulans]
MYLSVVSWVALLLEGAAAAPTWGTEIFAVKERHIIPQGWTRIASLPDSHLIDLRIGLHLQNPDIFQRRVMEVSDPSHARYGQYLSAAEIRSIVAPSEQSIDMVQSWLSDHGIHNTTLTSTGDWINVRLPVRKVETILNTTYSMYGHNDGSILVRTPEWSLPKHLHKHIDVIQPTTSFFRLSKHTVGAKPERGPIKWHNKQWWRAAPNDSSIITPCEINVVCNVTGTNSAGATVTATTLECLRCLYGTINYVPKVPQRNMIGVTNYLNETQKRSDIKIFLQNFRPEAVGVADTFPIINIANAQNQQGSLDADQLDAGLNIEGDLDGELAIGISWPTRFMSWSTGGSPPFLSDLATPTDTNEPYLEWLNYVLAQEHLPQVISTSYGDDEQTVPYSYAKRVCDGFQQLGARGISVIFSSGDFGVGADGACFSNSNTSHAMFLPTFPASCPWVTSVGGTQGFQPEIAVTRFGSGAGFSNYFPVPAYQASAVDKYINDIGDLYAGLYNRTGRGYPDVAAQGNHDVIVWEGNVTTVGGTSASGPTFAAIIALVNDALIAAGKPALGFLNPWIYGGAFAALTDITTGSSIGCDTPGFPAAVGWDAVTGFGTPNLHKLITEAFRAHRV